MKSVVVDHGWSMCICIFFYWSVLRIPAVVVLAALLRGPFGHTYYNRIHRLFGQSEQVLPVKQVYVGALRHTHTQIHTIIRYTTVNNWVQIQRNAITMIDPSWRGSNWRYLIVRPVAMLRFCRYVFFSTVNKIFLLYQIAWPLKCKYAIFKRGIMRF